MYKPEGRARDSLNEPMLQFIEVDLEATVILCPSSDLQPFYC